jgi:hypothetical protein
MFRDDEDSWVRALKSRGLHKPQEVAQGPSWSRGGSQRSGIVENEVGAGGKRGKGREGADAEGGGGGAGAGVGHYAVAASEERGI